jgi:hypothetical protein
MVSLSPRSPLLRLPSWSPDQSNRNVVSFTPWSGSSGGSAVAGAAPAITTVASTSATASATCLSEPTAGPPGDDVVQDERDDLGAERRDDDTPEQTLVADALHFLLPVRPADERGAPPSRRARGRHRVAGRRTGSAWRWSGPCPCCRTPRPGIARRPYRRRARVPRKPLRAARVPRKPLRAVPGLARDRGSWC